MILWIVVLSILAGIFGRMGGIGKPFKSWMRDWIIPLFFSIAVWRCGFSLGYWWVLVINYIPLGGSLTTYLDSIFGYDNFFAAGFMVGVSSFLIPLFTGHWWLFAIRAILLAVIWGSLNRWLPERILFWHRDTVEEFCRYAAVIGTAPMLI